MLFWSAEGLNVWGSPLQAGPIDDPLALLIAPLKFLYQAPGRAHGRQPLSRWLSRSYFPVRGASSALWVSPPRVGLGGYAPLPTARDGTDPQGSRDHPTGKCTGIVNGRQSMRRPQGPPSEGVESCRTLLDARRGPADESWPARGDQRVGSGESRRAPLADLPLAG